MEKMRGIPGLFEHPGISTTPTDYVDQPWQRQPRALGFAPLRVQPPLSTCA